MACAQLSGTPLDVEPMMAGAVITVLLNDIHSTTVVPSRFNLTNTGGLHVTTATVTPLIVTARTFDDTAA